MCVKAAHIELVSNQSTDPHDLGELTTTHVLIGEPLIQLLHVNMFSNRVLSFSCRWQLMNQILIQSWSRWTKNHFINMVRVATLRTSKGLVKRPLHQLSALRDVLDGGGWQSMKNKEREIREHAHLGQ